MSLPFYVFAQDSTVQSWETANRVALATFVPPRYGLRDDQIIDYVTVLLRLSPNGHRPQIEVRRWPNAATLAQHLLDPKGFELVALFDEEPSIHVYEFLSQYRRLTEQRRLADSLRVPLMFPLDLAQGDFSPHELVPNATSARPGVDLTVVRYDDQAFYDLRKKAAVQGAIAIGRRGIEGGVSVERSFPLVASNFRHVGNEACWEPVQGALRDTYFGVLPNIMEHRSILEGNRSRVAQEVHSVYRSYFLNSYLGDRGNKIRGLAFYGFLVLTSEQVEDHAGRADRMRGALGVDLSAEPDRILRQLGLPQEASVRQRFAGDPKKAYSEGERLYEEAMANPNRSVPLLRDARKAAIAAIGTKPEAKQHQSSRGMWSISNYQPFWLLARIELAEALASNRPAGVQR